MNKLAMNNLALKVGALALFIAQSACADEPDTTAAVQKAVTVAQAVTAVTAVTDVAGTEADKGPDTGIST